MANGRTAGTSVTRGVWATSEAKPGNLGLSWKKNPYLWKEQNPLMESEGCGGSRAEATVW